MFFKRKLTRDDLLFTDAKLIEKSALSIGKLVLMAVDREDIRTNLTELQIIVQYFSPSSEQGILYLDRKIDNLIGDLKIALNKSALINNYTYSSELLKKLSDLIFERKNLKN